MEDTIEPAETVSLIGRGLTSCTQVPELQLTTLTSVCLHGNDISGTEGLSHLTRLQHLNLSSNAVSSLDGIQGLTSLVTLNLSSNRLTGALPSLHALNNLTYLNLSYNGLTSLQGLHALLVTSSSTSNAAANTPAPGAPLPLSSTFNTYPTRTHPLCKLNVKHNLISSVQAFGALLHFSALQELSLGGNPVCMQPNHRQQLLNLLPQLAVFDDTPSHNISAAPGPVSPPALQPVLPQQAQHMQQQQQVQQPQPQHTLQQTQQLQARTHTSPFEAGAATTWTPQAPQQPILLPPQQHAHFVLPAPHMPPFDPQPMLPLYQLPHQHHQHNFPGLPHSQEGPPSHPPLHFTQPSQPQQQRNQQHAHGQATVDARLQPLGWSNEKGTAAPDHCGTTNHGGGSRGRGQDASPPVNRTRKTQGQVQNQSMAAGAAVQGSVQGPGHPIKPQLAPAAACKVVYLVDAAVQASGNKAAAQVQREVEQLKAQLAEMTEELKRRTRVDREAQRQISNILQAGEEDAQQRIEEGYREASQAVSKALREVEASRRAALESEERVSSANREKQAAQAQIDALQQQLHRLQQDSSHAAEVRETETSRVLAALREELKKASEVEAALKLGLQEAQLQACNAGKAELKSAAALAAAEQRIASLEASLQQSSSTAVALTARVAQTISDADSKVSALKAQLASAQQTAEGASGREHELLGRVKALTEASASAAQQHAKELEQVRQQAAADIAAARASEAKAAEERGRLCMAAQAEQERSVLQEQLTYLKVQLQYALEESDKERSGFQDRLTASEQQVSTLSTALQEASQKGRVFEDLVTDLSNVVSQQKLHIQALQKEHEALTDQLRSSGPEQIQKLTAELAAAKGAAADAAVMREQAEANRQRWQDAERRIVEQQADAMKRIEELNHKCLRLDKACAAAREEAQRSAAQAVDLASQLSSAEDGLKIKMAMLDSAHDSISALKAELEDYAAEAEEARRTVEELEAHAAQQAEADNQEKANLRSELVAGETALESMSQAVNDAQAKMKEAEERAKEAEKHLKTVEEQLQEKSDLIKYVEEEVERVKGMFEKREGRVREERDVAQAAAERAQKACSIAEVHLAEAVARGDTLAAELSKERSTAAAALEASARAQAEADRLGRKLEEVECEMRALLDAVERQKLASVSKMRQLASFLTDLG